MTARARLFCLFFCTALIGLCAFAAADSFAQDQKAKRNYTEVVLNEKSNNPKAADIVRKIMKADLDEAMTYSRAMQPAVHAQFIALGPNLPKTSIMAMIEHIAYCGSSGCRVVVLTPTKDNRYKITFDAVSRRMFQNLRPGQAYYDLLGIAPPRVQNAFGVFYWDEKNIDYKFAGFSRFASQ